MSNSLSGLFTPKVAFVGENWMNFWRKIQLFFSASFWAKTKGCSTWFWAFRGQIWNSKLFICTKVNNGEAGQYEIFNLLKKIKENPEKIGRNFHNDVKTLWEASLWPKEIVVEENKIHFWKKIPQAFFWAQNLRLYHIFSPLLNDDFRSLNWFFACILMVVKLKHR